MLGKKFIYNIKIYIYNYIYKICSRILLLHKLYGHSLYVMIDIYIFELFIFLNKIKKLIIYKVNF